MRLKTEGEGAEVDRTVIERLADPLTHMIRNAIDHGLETPDARTAAGKPEQGEVRLSAAHDSGRDRHRGRRRRPRHRPRQR